MRRFIYDEPVTGWAVWCRRIAVFAVFVTIYAVFLLRGGAQDIRGGSIAAAAVGLALLAILVGAVAFARIWRHGLKGVGIAAQGWLIALALLALPAFYLVRGATLPLLNDVTTDIDNPPTYSRSRAALAARNGRVPPDVDRSVRERQRTGYPAVVPILLEVPAEEAFDLSRKAATTLGWRIIEQAAPGGRTGVGRIEATETTRILRFTDDITIRIRARAEGSRIDVRSASRVGSHDYGTNARRIRRFADQIEIENDAR